MFDWEEMADPERVLDLNSFVGCANCSGLEKHVPSPLWLPRDTRGFVGCFHPKCSKVYKDMDCYLHHVRVEHRRVNQTCKYFDAYGITQERE